MVSLSEHAQILKEVGLGSTNTSNNETIRIQHVFLFAMNDAMSQRWETIVQRAVEGWLALGRQIVVALLPCVRLLITAGSVYLVLYGTSQVIASIQSGGSKNKRSQ